MPYHETARWERARFQNDQILRVLGSAFALAFYAGSALQAQATVTISADATQNMTCSAGLCAPTARDAVLNVGDLENLLASGNAEVTTSGAGVQADNIVVSAGLSWSTSSALTFDAYQSIAVDEPVSVAGLSGLTLTTNDGGLGGQLSFGSTGNVTFENLSSALTINGASYVLVDSIVTLASAIASNPGGDYALAAAYDAKQDGTYRTVPIPTTLTGTVEGLGNTISHFRLKDSTEASVGLLAEVGSGGTLRDTRLTASTVKDVGGGAVVGVMLGTNMGTVFGCHASGAVNAEQVGTGGSDVIGGLVGDNVGGIIEASSAATSVSVPKEGSVEGGLAGGNSGFIENSYATGDVIGAGFASPPLGGLVGISVGGINGAFATGAVTGGNSANAGGLVGDAEESSQISNTYSTGPVAVGPGRRHRYSVAGGLIGLNDSSVAVSTSYSTGAPTGAGGQSTCTVRGVYTCVGGSIGWNDSAAADIVWDVQTSGTNNATGNGGNSGITGLTSHQLKSGLPVGFDPSIWGEQKGVNHGLPYLLAIPPK
jgi:hypothetical protein